ncbi:MAG TPA: sugar nucleotide-binding protein [Planctomycetota bacterium]|nr:sugar nucleotide-binding protein [Planctomycetota bacterium]
MPPLRILVTGATGFLGPHAVAALRGAGHVVVTAARTAGDAAVDLCAPGMVAAVAQALAPDVVLHLAAMARLADCEREPERAARTNAWLPEQFAARFGSRLLHVSTDLVFDGRAAPYDEASPVAPLSVYGCSKAEGDERVRARGGRVVRLPLLFGPDAAGRGATAALRAAQAAGRPSALYTNEYRTPLHAADAAQALAQMVVDPGGPPLRHLPGPERCSRWEFARRFCAQHGMDEALLRPVECQDAARPRDVSLAGAFRARRSLAEMLADS